LLVLCVLLAAGLVLLPYGAKWYLEAWLRDRGVVNVSIGDVDINPFVGVFAVESLEFEDEGIQRRAGHALLNLSWTDLLQRRIRLSRVELRDAALEIRRTDSNRWLLGTIALGAQEAVQEAERVEAEAGWGFGIDSALFEDVAIDYRDPLIVRNLVVDEASLQDFATWSTDQQTAVVLALSSGEARLRFEGDTRPFAETFDLDFRVRGEQLDGRGLDALIEGTGLESIGGALRVDARAVVTVPPGDGETSIGIDGGLGIDDLDLVHRSGKLAMDGVNWEGAVQITLAAEGQRIMSEGELAIENLSAAAADGGPDLALEKFLWDGRLEQGFGAEQQTFSASADMGLDGLSMQLPGDGEASADSRLLMDSLRVTDSEFALAIAAGQTEGTWQGALQIEGAGLEREDLNLLVASLGVSGSEFAMSLDAGQREASWRGGLQIEDAGLASKDSNLTAGDLSWEGGASYSGGDGDEWRVDADGDVIATALGAGDAGREGTWLSLGRLRAVLAEAGSGRHARLAAVELSGLDMFARAGDDSDEPAHAISVAQIDIDGVDVAAEGIGVGEILIRDPNLWIERERDGKLEIAGSEEADDADSGDPGSTAATSSDQSGPSTAIRLAGVRTEGEARLTYVDRSVRPLGRFDLTPLEITIGAIDSAAPDQDTPIDFKASLGRYGRLAFAGNVRPLAPQTYVSGEGKLQSIDMIPLDGFARRAIGYSIESGTLSADIDVELQQPRLDSVADLTIRKLTIEPLKPDEQDEFSTELGVPLGVALGLLEDDQQTIKLEVPLRGDVSDLSVGFGDALRTVMQKGLMVGMRTAATTYFAPLWPALAATKLFAAASKLSFRPVIFPPGGADMTAEQDAYAGQMAGLLAKRPKVSLTLCGRAVAADFAALYPDAGGEPDEAQSAALEELARARHEQVKDALVEAGLDAARLVTCRAEASPSDPGEPRVDFGV
jgi:hypothetical protein